MALLPVTGNRSSSPLQSQRLLYQLNKDQLDLQQHYDQLSTGRRVLRMSDDPAAASRAVGLQRSVVHADQLARNAKTVEGFYAAADNTMAAVDSALIEARAAAVPAVQNTLSAGEREAAAATVRQSLEQVLRGGNAEFRDHQLLGGALQRGSGFQRQGDTVLFTGNDAVGLTRLSNGDPVARGVAVGEALGTTDPMVSSDPLDAALSASTRLSSLRGGRGARADVLRLSDGSGWTEIDLSAAATMGDVVDLINDFELGGRALNLTMLPDGARLEYRDGLPGTLAVADVPGGELAKDLQLANPQGLRPPPLVATGLAPQTTTETRLADLAGGAGIDVEAGLRIEQGEDAFVVDLSEANTVGDVLIAINRSDADVRAQLNPETSQIEIVGLRSGVDYSIGENGGQAASLLGIRSADGETRLDALARGRGIAHFESQAELTITRPDGVSLDLQFEGLETIDDVLAAINGHPANVGTQRVVASLAETGNGLWLEAPPGADPIQVRQPAGGTAGAALGLIPRGTDEANGSTIAGVATVRGADYAPAEAAGAVDTLLRLERAVRDDDPYEIERLQGMLDADLSRAVRARGNLGVWTQNSEIMRADAEAMSISLQGQLSEEIDADFTKVISQLNQRQTALEASLRLMGQTSQMTVLNYL